MRWMPLMLVIAVLVSACGGTDTGGAASVVPASPAPDGALDELETARQRWAAASLDSYHYVFRNDCGECDPSERQPREVVIEDGAPSGPRQHTVEDLFERVEQAIIDERSVEVTYHPDLGYPTDIAIDMEDRAFDGGTHWMAGDLAPGVPGD